MFRAITFAVALVLTGISLGLLAIGIVTDSQLLLGGFGAVFAIAVNVLALSLVLLLRGPSKKRLEEARVAGRSATALVRSVEATNRLVNDYRVYKVSLAVAPRDRSPYRTTLNQPMDPIAGPRLQAGDTISVVRVDANRPKVVWDPTARPDVVNVSALANSTEWRAPRRVVRVFPIIVWLLIGAAGGYFGGEYYAETRAANIAESERLAEEAKANHFVKGEGLAQALELAYAEYGSTPTRGVRSFRPVLASGTRCRLATGGSRARLRGVRLLGRMECRHQ